MRSQRANYSTEKSDRLEARISRTLKMLIQRAADLEGQSLTHYIVKASQEAAKKTIREHEVITLTAKQSENFVNVLMNPPAPNLALQKAAKRYRDFFKQSN